MQLDLMDSPRQYLQFIKDVDREGVGVHMDLVNMIVSPYRYTHIRELIDESFSLLGGWIRSCHIKDCLLPLGANVVIQEVPVDTGNMDISYYLQKIAALQGDIPVLFEHMNELEDYDEPFRYVRGLIG